MCIPACLDKITTHGLISKMCMFTKEDRLPTDFFFHSRQMASWKFGEVINEWHLLLISSLLINNWPTNNAVHFILVADVISIIQSLPPSGPSQVCDLLSTPEDKVEALWELNIFVIISQLLEILLFIPWGLESL